MPAERILLVDTEKNVLLAYNTVLVEEGYEVDVASTIEDALKKISFKPLSVLITELYLKGLNSLGMIKRAKHDHPEIYTIMITASTLTSEQYEEIIHAGVDDAFMKPFTPKDLLITIKKGLKRRSLIVDFLSLEEKVKKLQRQSPAADDYYGDRGLLSNNLYLNTIVQKEIIRSKRYNHPFSLVVFDLHAAQGDKESPALDDKAAVSNEVARILLHHTRKTDIVSGFNGSFVLILVETPLDGTKPLTERLQKEIARIPRLKDTYDYQHLSQTMKVDCFTYPQHADRIEKCVHEIVKWQDTARTPTDAKSIDS